MEKILIINTGSTSTKVAFFEGDTLQLSGSMQVPIEELNKAKRTVDQLSYRMKTIYEWLDKNKIDLRNISMVAARGGPLPGVIGGAYLVSDYMVDVMRYVPVSPHESGLSCMIAKNIGDICGAPAIIYDAVTTDESNVLARYTGCPGVPNSTRGHPLNSRKAARMIAKKQGIPYENGCYIVAHLGGSISVSAHSHGRIVDMVNTFNGPMGPQRAGRIPTDELIKMCYSGQYSKQEITKLLNGKSGFMGYFGTQDAKEVFEMADSGNELAETVIGVMAYQVAKGIAEMRIALDEPANAVILTGGMAYSEKFVRMVSERVSFIGTVEVVPGEHEMEALAEGALRVLRGEETAKEYQSLPKGYQTKEMFYSDILAGKFE